MIILPIIINNQDTSNVGGFDQNVVETSGHDLHGHLQQSKVVLWIIEKLLDKQIQIALPLEYL